MYSFIHDVNQVKKFHKILASLGRDEAYFLSASARNKYLTKEERDDLSLGRSEMFARKLVKSNLFEEYLRVLRTFETNEGSYTTRVHKDIPQKCMVIYANINPSSGVKALKEFNSITNDLMFELQTNKNAIERFAHLDSELMNCFQRSMGNKHFIDVDFDIPKHNVNILMDFCKSMWAHGVALHVIETAGGYHVLMVRKSLTFNYNSDIESASKKLANITDKGEVVVNVNSMVPVPGTMQAGFPVKFLETKK